MDKIKQDDPGDFDLASNETPARAVPERAAEPLWKKFLKPLSALAAVLATTGIVGSLVGAYFQQRAWNNEKAANKIQIDATKAFDLEQQVSDLIDERLAAAEEIEHAIKSHVSREEWERAWDQYQKNFEDWARQSIKLAGQIAFFVDTPFKRKTDDKRKEINDIPIDCLTYTLEFALYKNIDSQSASHLLQIIDHCYGLAKQDIEQASANKHPPASCEEWEQHICDFHQRKSHIWWLNHVLRCTMFERAVRMRNYVTETTWYFMPQIPSNYDFPQDPPDCVRDYHDNDHFGLAANPRKQ